jgi:hypothetical protein
MATLTRKEIARRIRRLPPAQQAIASALALKVYGPAPEDTSRRFDFSEYRFRPADYIQDKLGWTPWSGSEAEPGQAEIIAAYELALRQQIERREFEHGRLSEAQLEHWTPGEIIKNVIRVEAGHTVGKTKVASGLFSHFFDCFPPAIVYTFAPTWHQIKKLLWKEIETDRRGRDDLPGRILETCEIKHAPDHFATGAATSDAGGKGTERIQGQHGPYLLFILDEAEGVADFVYGAIDSMSSGGVVIVLMFANPRTRTSQFYKRRTRSNVRSFRMSCVSHPNVKAGREVIPGAVRRDYVETMIEGHCEVVAEHEDDHHTFALPFDVRTEQGVHPAGTIFRPDSEFLFRVLGIAPANLADDTFVPVGRYEAATARDLPAAGEVARMGVDVARYGKDFGTLYVRHGMRAWRATQLAQVDTNTYAGAIKTEARKLARAGVTSLHVRIDAGGGFGGGVADRIKDDAELKRLFADFRVIEVEFGSSAHTDDAYADLVTEMYAEAAESLKGLSLPRPPEALEQDLTERKYKWVNLSGVAVRRLEPKEEFRKPSRVGRSPDDGDGFVLSVAPDFLFPQRERRPRPMSYSTTNLS